MDIGNLMQYRDKIVSIGVIVVALIIAQNIYKAQDQAVQGLLAEKEAQLKKNEILTFIQKDENTIKGYKDILNKKDASLLVNNINNSARENNVKIVSVEPENKQGHSPYYFTYPFELTVSANSYHDLGKFIASLENSDDIFIIDKVDISKIDYENNRISARLVINSITVKEDNE